MAEPAEEATQQPLVQPRVVRFLKNRRKLIGGDLREDFLEELENTIAQRRMPDRAAEKAVDSAMSRAQEAASPVARERAKDKVNKLNDSLLDNL